MRRGVKCGAAVGGGPSRVACSSATIAPIPCPCPLPLPLPLSSPQECSLAHLIGLFRLDPGESLLSLGYRGALADCLLWALIRVQSHIFDSETYER